MGHLDQIVQGIFGTLELIIDKGSMFVIFRFFGFEADGLVEALERFRHIVLSGIEDALIVMGVGEFGIELEDHGQIATTRCLTGFLLGQFKEHIVAFGSQQISLSIIGCALNRLV
ncbi:MAG: hypothetical protein BWY75_03814 [bacterium ADurb.Bin425]|nr:MAG: hypothetical protein BWY75_03814 [bacterium ADurb.Bin425]